MIDLLVLKILPSTLWQKCGQSYDDDPLPGYQQIVMDSRSYGGSWCDGADESLVSDYASANESSRKGLRSTHVCPADHHHLSSTNLLNRSSPHHYSKSRRNSMGDIASISSSCNKCKPAVISSEPEPGLSRRGVKSNNIIVPLTDSHSSLRPNPRTRGLTLPSWLRLKKKSDGSVIERLRRELAEANDSRDAALCQAAGMRSSLGELRGKLEHLEAHCEELKKALKRRSMCLEKEAMVEGFLQMVSEARSSVRQFCKALLWQGSDEALVGLLQPYKLSLASKHSKAVVCHLEAVVNRCLYQDFENCVFTRDGAARELDPQQHREAQFQSFLALRDLDWNEVLRKGTKYYSEELSRFCDHKMSGIVGMLGCTRPWPEQLLQGFFVAAKCIWLLHLLAVSFDRPVRILRVEENMGFDGAYMEDMFADRQRLSAQGGTSNSRVKIMVMPGFYVLDQVLRCKVLCRYKSVS